MPASNLPGYLSGHRFSDAPAHYDPVAKRFRNLSAYGARGDLQITVGNPIFETFNGQRCTRLDNTCHGVLPSPIPWEGSVVLVLKPWMVGTATTTRYPLLFGDATTAVSNGGVQVVYAGGGRRVGLATPSAQLTHNLSRNDDNCVAVAFAISQETRLGYRSTDGVTVSAAVASASATTGNACALGSGLEGVRFGNTKGLVGDSTVDTVLTVSMMEQHFFSENILAPANLAATAAFLAELKAQYGAS